MRNATHNRQHQIFENKENRMNIRIDFERLDKTSIYTELGKDLRIGFTPDRSSYTLNLR